MQMLDDKKKTTIAKRNIQKFAIQDGFLPIFDSSYESFYANSQSL